MPQNWGPRKTPEQKQALLAAFAIEAYPTHARSNQIAKELDLPENSVWIWWQEQRRKQSEKPRATLKQRLSEPDYTPRYVNKTPDQKNFLIAQLAINDRPSDARCEEIGAEIGLTKSTVHGWFTRQRRKRSQVPHALKNEPALEPTLEPVQAVEYWAAAELYHYNILNSLCLEIWVLNDEVNCIQAIPSHSRTGHNTQVLQHWYQIHTRRTEAQTLMAEAIKKRSDAERALMMLNP